jgi:hypothetical protein
VSGGVPASNEDREGAIAQLRDHFAEGRIGPEELAARIERAYRARRLVEVRAVLRDLPAPRRRAPLADILRDPRRHLGLFVAVCALLIGVWLATGGGVASWPLVVALGWGVVVLVQLLGTRRS